VKYDKAEDGEAQKKQEYHLSLGKLNRAMAWKRQNPDLPKVSSGRRLARPTDS
jgi:hypothetical protein